MTTRQVGAAFRDCDLLEHPSCGGVDNSVRKPDKDAMAGHCPHIRSSCRIDLYTRNYGSQPRPDPVHTDIPCSKKTVQKYLDKLMINPSFDVEAGNYFGNNMFSRFVHGIGVSDGGHG